MGHICLLYTSGELIEFTQEEKDFLGTILADYYITVTPENVNDYYTPVE